MVLTAAIDHVRAFNAGPAEAIYSWSGKIYLDIMNVRAAKIYVFNDIHDHDVIPSVPRASAYARR